MKDLTQGSVTRHILNLSLFIGVSMLFQTLYYLVDLYFVSRLGKEAIAGVGLAGNLMMVILALTQMLSVGTTTLISHAAGRKEQPRAQFVFNQSFLLSVLVGLGVMLLGYVFRWPYAHWLAADAATANQGVAYLFWFVPSLGLQFALVSMGAALRGTGIVKPTMIVQALTVITNIVLAPVLIAGWGTHHPLGVAGAALSTLIAIIVGVVLMTWYLRRCSSERMASTCFSARSRFSRRSKSRSAQAPIDLGNDLAMGLSLPLVRPRAVASSIPHLEGDAEYRFARGRRVCAARRVHRADLLDHPGFRRGRAGRFRNWRASDAVDIPAGNVDRLCHSAGCRPEFWGTLAEPRPTDVLLSSGNWRYRDVRIHAVVSGISRLLYSLLFGRAAGDCLRRRLPANHLLEFCRHGSDIQ